MLHLITFPELFGAMTISMTTFNIMTLSIMDLISTVSKSQRDGTQHLQCHSDEFLYAECRYAECHSTECRYAECRGALLSVIVLA